MINKSNETSSEMLSKKESMMTLIPTRWVGPIKLGANDGASESEFEFSTTVPLATFEKPLWFAVSRGARVSRMSDKADKNAGVKVTIVQEGMSRSVLVEGPNASYLKNILTDLAQPRSKIILQQVTMTTSAFAQLLDWHAKIVGNLLYVRFNFNVGDAAGHNMVTKAADALLAWLLSKYSKLRYISVSGNFCVDKKVSAVNGILGRGKYVVAEMKIPRKVCVNILRTTPEAMVELHIKKNLLGSMIAGSVHSANAHFANMLLALYLATGQDAANIVEGSQGIVHAEIWPEERDGIYSAPTQGDLYFSVTLPNIIVGTVGSGKNNKSINENLKKLGCKVLEGEVSSECGKSSRRLAAIVAATVWCGELSLLAAQTNRGELVHSHMELER